MARLFYDLTYDEILDWVQEKAESKFRAKQIYLWQKSAASLEEMSNLSKDLRRKLGESFSFNKPKILSVLKSEIDGTEKYLFELEDGQILEAVLMRYKYGNTICLSTQAGCRMGCDFCASTQASFARNLSCGEMLTQVAEVEAKTAEKIRRVVLMGIGEPLENLAEVIKFCERIHDPLLFDISYRRMTLSTCGLVPEIYALAKAKLPITLSISLHSPFQERREAIMPIAKRYKISELIEAAQAYFKESGRRVSYEYTLFRDFNDRPEDLRELQKLFAHQAVHINLIPANNFPGSVYYPPLAETVENFKEGLHEVGIEATVRRSLGRDIEAACGQLRLKYLANNTD
ncbi:MAG: 23S rRNA (adenine(2503)-C(2))-methyltransferase RlmN [Eubacteriales bacterium]|nr:23S rRNA (adenine(2503)-C(2))-methyltransferase RlmN [Eubacteriales bacterium]